MPKPKPAKARPSLKPEIDRIAQRELEIALAAKNTGERALWLVARRLAAGAVVQDGPLSAELVGEVPDTFQALTAVDAADHGIWIGPRD
jgi:hypothetical protein